VDHTGLFISTQTAQMSEWLPLTCTAQRSLPDSDCMLTISAFQSLLQPFGWVGLTLWRPLMPFGYSCKAFCARPG